MKNRRLEVTLSRTINMGNYESVKPQVGLTVDIEDSDDLQECYDMLYSDVEVALTSLIEKEISYITEARER